MGHLLQLAKAGRRLTLIREWKTVSHGYKALVPLDKHFCPGEYEVCKKMQFKKKMQLSESTMKFVNEIQKLAKQ